jgi:membrane-associated phospholipid phosphatase
MEATSPLKIWRNVLISVFVFIVAFVVAVNPDSFDRPVTRFINGFVDSSTFFDKLVWAVFAFPTFSGVLLMALIWFCWFEADSSERRSRILIGTLASFGAGVVSRLLQHTLPTHPRPYYDKALEFRLPSDFPEPLNTWDSFPSDHVAVFAGLVVVTYIARSRFAFAATVFTAVVELARTYMGAHYPSDLLGGAALASIVVWAVQAPIIVSLAVPVVKREQSSPSLFYTIAFFLSYQIPTLFGDIRWAASLFWKN